LSVFTYSITFFNKLHHYATSGRYQILRWRKSLCFVKFLVAPVLYAITVIVGAALRNDYSHIVNAICELIPNGAPNKAVLDIIFNIYNALLLAFAIGGYSFLKNTPRP
jgi:hypothetical protein